MYFTVADLYTKLYDAILKDPSTGHGREGFYFGANGHYKWYDAAKAIAQALVDAGKGKSPEPTSLTPEELQKYTMVRPLPILVVSLRPARSAKYQGLTYP